jgi:hypothetical protein
MNRNEINLTDKKQTGDSMYWIVDSFYSDLIDFVISGKRCSDFTIIEWFNLVRKIPYKIDIKPIEIIARPKFLLMKSNTGLDCKKKAILIAAWAKCNNIEFRFMTSSKRLDKKIHHVFPQLFLNNRWLNFDATYKDYKPLEPKIVTNAEIL